MKAVVQRVANAKVTVDGAEVGAIGRGLCVFLGVSHSDSAADAKWLAGKLARLRVFADEDQKMNLSVLDTGGDVLVVSQFTLYGDGRKGNRPSFVQAAPPEVAEPLIHRLAEELTGLGVAVATGRFRADMQVSLVNDGPVTIILESPGY